MNLRRPPRPLATLAAVAVCASAFARPAVAQEGGAGTYRCEAERAISIRHDEDGTPRLGAETPVAPRFTITVAPTHPDDGFLSCMAIAGSENEAIRDYCRETNDPIFAASLDGREEPWFGIFYAWGERVEMGGPVTFVNFASSLSLRPAIGDFRYTMIYSEPQSVPTGYTFDYVTEQGRCDKE